MTWSYLILMAISAIGEINALREVLWQQVGKFLFKRIIALWSFQKISAWTKQQMDSELNRNIILQELHMIDKKCRAIYGHVCPLQQTWEALITMWLLKHKFFHSSDYFSLQSLLLKSNALIISMLFLIVAAWENENAFTKRFRNDVV